ncbi:AAA family ATPase [Lachnospiraceae bacterium HCP1S3_C3]
MTGRKELLNQIQSEIGKAVSGKEEIVKKIFTAVLAGGHVLLEDVPGVGKTTLAIAFSKVLNLSYRRMQFTPDVLPADVIGFSMYNKKINDFEFKPGAAVCNLLLADEINRTSPKTQAALLEVMEEKKVTVDGVTRNLPSPFIVIATQNPSGYVGTQKLPESQLDRFMLKLSMGYPEFEDEINVYKGRSYDSLDKVKGILDDNDINEMKKSVSEVYVDDSIYEYLTKIVRSTRENEYISLGISPRGGLALMEMAKATAYLDDREYVVPEDIINNIDSVCTHRIVLSSKAKASGLKEQMIMDKIKTSVEIPKGSYKR